MEKEIDIEQLRAQNAKIMKVDSVEVDDKLMEILSSDNKGYKDTEIKFTFTEIDDWVNENKLSDLTQAKIKAAKNLANKLKNIQKIVNNKNNWGDKKFSEYFCRVLNFCRDSFGRNYEISNYGTPFNFSGLGWYFYNKNNWRTNRANLVLKIACALFKSYESNDDSSIFSLAPEITLLYNSNKGGGDKAGFYSKLYSFTEKLTNKEITFQSCILERGKVSHKVYPAKVEYIGDVIKKNMALFCKNQQEIDRAVDAKIISLKNENYTLKAANRLLQRASNRLRLKNNEYNSVGEITFGKFCKSYIENKKDIYTNEVITNLKKDVNSFMAGKIYKYGRIITGLQENTKNLETSIKDKDKKIELIEKQLEVEKVKLKNSNTELELEKIKLKQLQAANNNNRNNNRRHDDIDRDDDDNQKFLRLHRR